MECLWFHFSLCCLNCIGICNKSIKNDNNLCGTYSNFKLDVLFIMEQAFNERVHLICSIIIFCKQESVYCFKKPMEENLNNNIDSGGSSIGKC